MEKKGVRVGMEKHRKERRRSTEKRGGEARVEAEVTAPTVSKQSGVQVSQSEF